MSGIISKATISNVVDDLAYFGHGQMNSTAALDACGGECESMFRAGGHMLSGNASATTVLKVLLPLGLLVGIIALVLRSRIRTTAIEKGGKDRGLDLPVDPVKSRSVVTAETHSDTDSVSDFEDELTAESPTRPIKGSSRDEVVEDLVMHDADETNKTGIPTTDARRKVEANETEVLSTTDKSREIAEAIVATSACRSIAEEAIAEPAAAKEGEAKTRSFQVEKKKEEDVVVVEEVVGKGAAAQQPDAQKADAQKEQLRAFLAKTDSERLESLRSANIRSIDDLRKSKLDDLSKVVPRQVARRLFSYATAIPKTVWSSMPSLWPRMQGTSPRRLCSSS